MRTGFPFFALFLGCLFVGLMFGCHSLPGFQPAVYWHLYQPEEIVSAQGQSGCADRYGYAPDTAYLSHFPMRYINVSFYFIGDTAGRHSFTPEAGRLYARNLLYSANNHLASNQPMWLPPGNNTPVLPINFMYRLAHDSITDDGRAIYFYTDEELGFYVKEGAHRNVYDRRLLQRYPCKTGRTLRIFILEHHPDSIASPTYDPTRTGVALAADLAIKMAGSHYSATTPVIRSPGDTTYNDAWTYAGLLNHETGHILSLSHSWLPHDGCDDTVPHPNCWNIGPPPCDTMASNNVMDYNTFKTAWTPCQISRIHHRMSELSSSVRKALEPVWCSYDENQTVYIDDNVVWNTAKDLAGDVVVLRGGSLEVSCRLSLPPEGAIFVEAGASISILPGAVLRPDCPGFKTETESDLMIPVYLQQVGDEKGRVIILQ